MNYNNLLDFINNEGIDKFITNIKGNTSLYNERKRYLNLLNRAYEKFGDGDYHFIFSPGRIEIGGNHTDHQHGQVVAASVNIGNLCVVKKSEDSICTFCDDKFDDLLVNIDNLTIKENEKNSSNALIRGIAYKLKSLGYDIGGFRAICDSEVLVGSGMSSSACFEVMVCEIFNTLYNDGQISVQEKADVAKYSENVFYGKPSGQLDQLTIASGGLVYIDFKDVHKPIVENYEFDFNKFGYDLVLIDTKGSHDDLSQEYGDITKEMKQISKCLNVDVLKEGDKDYFYTHIKDFRKLVNNDRAILRAFHFYQEDERTYKEKIAIKNEDINSLLKLMKESGKSSFMYLQNAYVSSIPYVQPLTIALALCEYILADNGAYRLHGGGFAGTILAVVPHDSLEHFKLVLSSVFDEDALLEVHTINHGTICVI